MSFGLQARQLHDTLTRQGIGVFDMRSEPALEPRMVMDDDRDLSSSDRPTSQIIWQESGSTSGIAVAGREGPSPFCWFLDGVQRTMPAYHTRTAPLIAAIASAALLTRDSRGRTAILPGYLLSSRNWLVPLGIDDPPTEAFATQVRLAGFQVVDTLANLTTAERQAVADDYFALERVAFNSAGEQRKQLESTLLQRWGASALHKEGWLLVDGPLRQPIDHAIGLVKQFTRQFVSGSDAAALFSLPVNQRTPALSLAEMWQSGPRTLWYLRMRNAEGRDPRYGLVRIEVNGLVSDSAEIDRLSAAILAERAPRASSDARWPTLVYPIHLLERSLKSHLDTELRGWPGVTQT